MPLEHHLILFAKYPYYGKAKTRLEPALGKEGAQQFAESALLEALHYFGRLSNEDCKCVWCYAPVAAGKDVQGFLAKHDLIDKWEAWPQDDGAEDLGARLTAAVQKASKEVETTSENGTCTLIGTDCFHLRLDHIKMGISSASKDRCFLIPATDGGYVLLSVPQPASPFAFNDIQWSSPDTGNNQRLQLEKVGYKVDVDETPLSDVDEPKDLQAFSAEIGEHVKSVYPRTLAFIHEYQRKRQKEY
jgi:glycosyltransferase A (GT-A) superfamily protein (DUF2064 family)